MTRQYWTNHKREKGLITDNRHIAGLLINNFRQPEIRIDQYKPYVFWKAWLELNPIEQPKDK